MELIMPIEMIENRILLIRGQKVILDRDLANIYGVEPKYLNRQVKRNIARFPQEFMFQLTSVEKHELVTNWHRFKPLKHSTYPPYAFTEHGVAMLATLLKSPRAIKVSILIINTFVRLRRLLASHKELGRKIEELERKYSKHEVEITTVFKVLKKLMARPVNEKPKRGIGFLRG